MLDACRLCIAGRVEDWKRDNVRVRETEAVVLKKFILQSFLEAAEAEVYF